MNYYYVQEMVLHHTMHIIVKPKANFKSFTGFAHRRGDRTAPLPKLIEGNGCETQQSSLVYVFVLFFGLDRAQNNSQLFTTFWLPVIHA